MIKTKSGFKIRNKKAQMTIWVVIAIVLVAAILLFFFVQRKPSGTSNKETNPEIAIQKCAKEAAEKAIDIMLPQGGFISPTNYKYYKGDKIAYLCQNLGNYEPCISQHPLFIAEMKKEIENYSFPIIDKCFQDLKKNLEEKNNKVELEGMSLSVDMAPNRVYLDIDRKMIVTGSETQTFDKFKATLTSPVYDIGTVAMEIAYNEAIYCYFEYVGYSLLYPKFYITKDKLDDDVKIYVIKDKQSNEAMNIAIRSCAIPPALGI